METGLQPGRGSISLQLQCCAVGRPVFPGGQRLPEPTFPTIGSSAGLTVRRVVLGWTGSCPHLCAPTPPCPAHSSPFTQGKCLTETRRAPSSADSGVASCKTQRTPNTKCLSLWRTRFQSINSQGAVLIFVFIRVPMAVAMRAFNFISFMHRTSLFKPS